MWVDGMVNGMTTLGLWVTGCGLGLPVMGLGFAHLPSSLASTGCAFMSPATLLRIWSGVWMKDRKDGSSQKPYKHSLPW